MVILNSSFPQSNIEIKIKMMKIKPVTVHYNFDDSIYLLISSVLPPRKWTIFYGILS
jgi:hypothetical protein